MIRSIIVLFVVAMLSISSARASLDRKEDLAGRKLIRIRSLFSLSVDRAKDDAFRITSQTEVLLDGRPCSFDRIPKGATIVLLETITNESKEITRIHFRSPRRSDTSTATKSR